MNNSLSDGWDWITAINIKTSIPGNLPLRFYADIGTFHNAGKQFGSDEKFIWDMGIELSIINKMFEIYFPLAMSKDLENNADMNFDNYMQKVRFTLRLELLNPFKQIKRVDEISM